MGLVNRKCFMAAVFVWAFLIFSACPVVADKAGEMDALAKGLMEEDRVIGLALGLDARGEKALVRAYGFADAEHEVELTTDSVFQIGSLSKTFTALAILILAEEGKLGLDDPVSKFYPWFPNGEAITMRRLLTHTSGLKELLEIEVFRENQDKDWKPHELLRLIADEPLDFEPGQQARYSNSNFILLGLVVERAGGMPFGEFVVERIAKPLGMKRTRLGSHSRIEPGRVLGYHLEDGQPANAEYVSYLAPYASGGMQSTIEDIMKLKRAFKPGVLLKKQSIEAMLEPCTLTCGPCTGTVVFGMGLDMILVGGTHVPGKTGSLSGFNAYFLYDPSTDRMAAALANQEGVTKSLVKACLALAGIKGEIKH